MSDQRVRLWLIRHGETEWSLSGAHTSRTEIPLTDRGRERAAHMADHLHKQEFSLVLTSPRQRARETCGITGYGDVAQIDSDLSEWDYGEYEGRTTTDIRKGQPGWTIWRSNPRDGETLAQVRTRAQSVIDGARLLLDKLRSFPMPIFSAYWLPRGLV